MNFYITKPADYWIATNAVSISLNALGHKDRIQGSVASGAVIMCFVADIKPESAGGEPGNGDGLWYDANHEPKRWPLSLTPTSFKTQTRKYIYAAIPRSTSVGNTAVIVFPSQMLDVYGRIKHGEGEEETYEQIGSEDYFYVYLQGIISDSIDRATRVWEQEITNWGTLGTAQGNDEKLVEGEWYRWSTVSQTVTFLKKIIMDAGSQFMNIRLRDKELTGVATAATGAEYVDSETLVVTPSYLQDKFISKKNDDEAEGVIGFLKGIWFGIKDKWFIDDKGDATLHDINANSVQSPSVKTNNVQSSDYTGDGLADTGFRLFSEGGHSKLTVDEIYVRTKLVAEELETKKRTYTGGDQIWSCAGNKVVRVDYLGNTETADHVPVMIPVHADGSPSTAGAADTFMVPQAGDTYGYSYIEVPWLARGLALLAGNKALSKYRKVRIVMQEAAATRSTRAAASPISHVRRARCYFLANDGENEIQNWWRINDLARCQTMNLANTTRKTYIADEDTKQGNIFWWRKVIGVSYEPVTLDDGKQYHYFDVAFDYDIESSSPETMVTSVMEGSDIPAAGDAVVQFGNTIIEGRMNLMMMEVNGSDAVGYNPSTDAPCLKAYRGVYSFDLTKCWIGGQCCKMKLSPKTGYEFYGPNFKMVTEYDVVPVPMDRGLWNDITPTRDDYREHANVRKCYYYDKVSHNGSYWLCSIVDGSHWVNASGNYISDADYAALSDDAKAQCARKQNYTIDEPSEESSDWTLVVEKGEKGDAGDTPISVFAWNQSPDTAPAISGNAYPPTGWNVTAPSRPSTAGDHYLWMSQSVKHANDTIDNWGTPVRISGDKGDAGEDASDQEFVYIRLTAYPFPNNVTKPADATRGKVHGAGDWIPAADQYETDDWVPEGWSDTALPATENEKYVYAAIRKKSAGHDEDWDDFGEPFLWSNWGVQGIDGDGVQYVYKLFDHELTAAERESNIPTKPQSQTQGEWIPTGWSDDPLAPTVNMQYCYCSTIKKIGGSWADTFDTLGLWSRFSKDGQSAYKSVMFVRLNTTPTKPANNKGSYNNPSPSDCPAGTSGGSTIYWSDGIPSGEAQIWATSRIFTNDGTSPQQSSWSTPQSMSDTDTFDVEFAVMQTNDAVPATPTANNRHKDAYPYGYEGQVWFDPDLDKYSAEGVLRDFTQMYWRAERECKNGDWGDWTIQRIKGEKGDAGDTPISVFAWNQSPDTAPAISGNAYPPTGWNVTAPSRPSTAGDHYLWMSQSVKHANDTIDNWGTPVRISGDKGDAGEDASDQEFVYIRLTAYPFPNNVTKPADATRGKVHGTGDWIPAADQYETDDWVPEGWSDTALPATENEKYVYAAIRKKSSGHDEDWDDFGEPFLWSNWGVQGIDGDGVQYVYKLFDHELTAAERESNIPTKPQSQTQGEWIPTGWSDDPLAPTVNMQYCYCSTIKKIGGSWADTFDTLGLWSRFSKDGQSAYKSVMFVRLNTTPTKPANNKGSYNNPSPSDCPAGTSGGSTIYWSDGIPSGEAQIWATSRIFTNDGTSPQQSSWSTPQPMSDTDTFDVEFAVMQTNDAVPAAPTANNRHKDAYPYGYEGQVWFDPDLDKYSAEGVLRDFTQMYWRAERECKNGDWGDWTIQRIKGEKGDPGTNGDTPMQAFQWNQSPTSWPTPKPTDGTLGNWSPTAPNRPSGTGEYYLWMTQTVKHVSANGTVTYDTWSDPVRISGNNGTNGEDGTDYEYIYILKTTQYTFPTNEKPANISTGEVSPGGHAASGSETDKQLDDWVPNGWWDNPQGIDSTNKFEYMSLRVKPKGSNTWGAYSDPFIWSHWGRNGMDGDGTEYVFIRTKNNVPPVMDSTQSGYTADEFRPTITPASQAASDTEQAQTTDDPKGTNDTYKYEWCAKRNMDAPNPTTGQRTWKKFTGENNDYKMSLWSNYAESPLVIDIDNEADQFGTDSLGVVTPAPQVKTTEVSLSYGATAQVLNADDAATPGVAAALFYEDDTAVPSTIAEVSCHRDTTDTTKGEVEVTIKSGTFPSAHSGIYAQITATCARGSKSISFTIQQVKSGAPGVAPDLCNLRPTTNSINFTKSEQQGSTRKTLGCGYTLVTPLGTTNVAKAESVVVNGTTYYIYWRYVGGTYAKFTTSAAIYNPGILPTTSESGVEFCLSSATSASGITDANTLDYEKVPILKDGKDGNASITIALTNENEDFLYNEAGSLIAPVGGATSQASLKEGTTDRTTFATWAVSCDGGTTWAEQGAYTSGNAKAKITPSGGLLSVEELYQDSVVIKVRAFYGYKYYYKDFTANKVSQDKYDIHVSPSSIAFNDSESWTSKQITSTASGVDLQGNPIAVTISSDVTPVAGRFYVFYGYVNSDGSVGTMINTEGTYVTLNRTMARSKMGVYFELRKYITASTYRLCDYETVEIAKTENGADALTFETNPPTPITINQSKTTTTDFGLPKTITFSGKRGTVALTNVVVTQISNAVGVTAVVSSPNDNTCKITAIVPSTVGQQTVYPDEFSFDASISFTDTDGTTKSYTEHISGYINYIGTFRVEVIGDAERAVAASMSQGYGSSKTLTQFGTYIRSSEENISTLEKTVAAKNHMPSSGYTNLSGVISTTNFNEEEQSFSGNAYTPCLVLLAGTYCLSAFSSGSGLACARRVLAYSGNTKPAKPSSITSETSINMSAVSPAETWDGMTRYKGTFTLSAKSYVFIKVTPPSGGTVAHVQLEKVSESTDNPTPWEEGAKYYTSQIKQTAETIEARANQAGLVIDGVNNHIDLIAGKVNFLTAGGATNPKISIDPQSGALNAVDGNFEGTVRAKNFYHRLSVVEGWTSETYYSQCVSLYITNATQFKSDAQDDGFLSEVSDVKNGDVLVWDAEHYPLGVQYGIFFDGSRPCTGDADEVLYVAAQSFSSYGTLYLPPAASCIGKKVTVHNRHFNNYGLTVYSADTSGEEIVSTGYVDSNHKFVIDSSHPGQGFSVDAGASCSFLAVDGGWLRLDFTPAHT